jgi:NAD+ kinase
MKVNKVLVIYKKSKLAEHHKAMKTVFIGLEKCLIEPKFVQKEKMEPKMLKNIDLVISVGGDGTFIEASHFIDGDLPMLGVNSDPSTSEGFHTSANRFDFEKRMEDILTGNFKTKKLARLSAVLNSKKLPLALNDIYVGSKFHFKASRYLLNFRGLQEEQKSSGIVFSTGGGSTAWYKSAGGEPFSCEAKEARFIVREPYCGRLTRCTVVKDKITEDEIFSIKSKMFDGCIAIDSLRIINFNRGDIGKIKISDKHLTTINF